MREMTPTGTFGALTFVVAIAMGCAGSLQSDGFTSGLSLSPAGNGYYVRFNGSKFSPDEHVQAFWLYNASVLTLQKGYDGFKLDGSDLNIQTGPASAAFPPALALLPGVAPGKVVQSNIILIKKPFAASPPLMFDAAVVKTALDEFVRTGGCNGETSCPHPLAHLALNPQSTLIP